MELLSNNKAAEFLGVSPLTLPRWRWAGTGPPFVRMGRSIKYRAEDLRTYVERRRVDPEIKRAQGS